MFELKDLPHDVQYQLVLYIKRVAFKENITYQKALDNCLEKDLFNQDNSLVLAYLAFLNRCLQAISSPNLTSEQAKIKAIQFAGSFEDYVASKLK